MIRFLLLILMTLSSSLVYGDDDFGLFGGFYSKSGVAAVTSDLYKSNCSECHFAYQPGLLPKRSWQKLMLPESLANHFGDNAELDEKDRLALLTYLTENAADNADYKRSKKMMRSIGENETPLRITKVAYFKRKHREISAKMVTGNPQVKSWSNCAACHTAADKGSFSEHGVRIPGYGRWED